MSNFLKTSRKNLWSLEIILFLGSVLATNCSHSPLPLQWGLDLALETERSPPVLVSSGGESYGPSLPDTALSPSSMPVSPSLPVVSLLLGPGLYRTMAFIPVLRALEAKGIHLHFIGGHGLSAIIATYYAFGLGPDLIEWKFHKFLTLHGGHPPYSKAWRRELSRMIREDFSGAQIEQAELNLFIPVYDPLRAEVSYWTKGDVFRGLMANINLDVGTSHRAAFLKEVYHVPKMKKWGAEMFIGLNVLGEALRWKSSEGFIVGLFSRSSALSKRQSTSLSFYREIKMHNIELDSSPLFAEIVRLGQVASGEIVESLKKVITAWPGG